MIEITLKVYNLRLMLAIDGPVNSLGKLCHREMHGRSQQPLSLAGDASKSSELRS